MKGREEAIIHRTKLSYEKYSPRPVPRVFCKLTSSKAFSSVNRSEMLKTVSSSMPGIAAFTIFCYSQHSQLFYDKFVVSSENEYNKAKQWALCFSL